MAVWKRIFFPNARETPGEMENDLITNFRELYIVKSLECVQCIKYNCFVCLFVCLFFSLSPIVW